MHKQGNCSYAQNLKYIVITKTIQFQNWNSNMKVAWKNEFPQHLYRLAAIYTLAPALKTPENPSDGTKDLKVIPR